MVRPLQIVLATANPDKVAEIADILASVPGLEILPRPDSVPQIEEDGDTLLDNARLKAFTLVEATGMAAVADDTGLEVEALGGAPGVYSARYSGEHATYAGNVAKLLTELERQDASVPARRSARFRTVAVVGLPDGDEIVAEGEVTGVITTGPRGQGGFGYDPIFAPDGYDGRTFAQMQPHEKHAISHRGRAFREVAARLAEWQAEPLR